MRRRVPVVVLTVALLAAFSAGAAPRPAGTHVGGDWRRFGYDAARSGVGPASTGVTATNVSRLVRQQVRLPGTADSSPIYLRGVVVRGKRRDVFFLTTSYGRTVAVDAGRGTLLWVFTPREYSGWAGSSRITHSSPLADPSRRWVYSASPDGRIHKLAVANGHEAAGWPVAITRDPTHEKIAPALNFARGLVLAATGGYLGDAPPYQGHVAAIDAATGRLVNVWNALCSNRSGLLDPPSCSESGSAIWARAGVVVDPKSGDLLVATGDGKWDGKTFWGDSVLILSPRAERLLQSWTPTNQAELDHGDTDLGSTAPALLSERLAVQGGKDGILRLLDLRRLNGHDDAPGRLGGELQSVRTPGAESLFSAPAVWHSGGRVWLFVGDNAGTAAYTLADGRLKLVWESKRPGTSPVVAGGLVYVYDPEQGGVNVYRPGSGDPIATLPSGSGHWNSPIVTDGRVALPEGDANDHEQSGVLDIYRVG